MSSEESQKVTIRLGTEEDRPFLKKWMMDDDILRWFPLLDEREVDDAIRILMDYIPSKALFAVCENERVAGMGVLYLHSQEKLKHQCLFMVIVDPDQRGKGLGSALVKEMIRQAKEKFGIELLHLEVYEGNPAFRLYERLGFSVVGKHMHFLKEPKGIYRNKIVMQMEL